MANIEQIKANLAELANKDGDGATLPASILAIIELAESGKATSGEILQLLQKTQQQLGASSSEIKEALGNLQEHLDAETQKNFSANKTDNEKIVGLLEKLIETSEKQHSEQKSENAKNAKWILALVAANLAAVLGLAIYTAIRHFAG